MPFKKHTPEEIIGKLREAEIVLAQGETTADGLPPAIDQRANLLPLAQEIWRSEDRSGSPDEGSGERECAATPCDLRSHSR